MNIMLYVLCIYYLPYLPCSIFFTGLFKKHRLHISDDRIVYLQPRFLFISKPIFLQPWPWHCRGRSKRQGRSRWHRVSRSWHRKTWRRRPCCTTTTSCTASADHPPTRGRCWWRATWTTDSRSWRTTVNYLCHRVLGREPSITFHNQMQDLEGGLLMRSFPMQKRGGRTCPVSQPSH